MTTLTTLLKIHRNEFASVLPEALQHGQAFIMDLTADSEHYAGIPIEDISKLIAHTVHLMEKHNAVIAIGRYGERRALYQRSQRFYKDGVYSRCIHLGIDLSAPEGTPIHAPLDGIIHSFKNNKDFGNYGPTIIVQHELEGLIFYTLYGHLSEESLTGLSEKKRITKGERFASIGHQNENGGWPPHLHFQIIDDMGDHHGDFPGVIEPEKQAEWMRHCPDPNLILNIKALN